MLDIHIALARLGEVDRVRALEKLTVERQIDSLDTFLQSTPRTSAARIQDTSGERNA